MTSPSFELASAVGAVKSMTGMDLLVSLWVYVDDLNTEQNVIYVSLKIMEKMYFTQTVCHCIE